MLHGFDPHARILDDSSEVLRKRLPRVDCELIESGLLMEEREGKGNGSDVKTHQQDQKYQASQDPLSNTPSSAGHPLAPLPGR
jgi:hypothetical protein